MLKEIYIRRYYFAILASSMLFMMSIMMVSATSNQFVYDDTLSSEWEDRSLLTTADFESTEFVHDGTNAMAVTHHQGLAALYLYKSEPLDIEPYQGMRFWLHGGEEGEHHLNFTLVDEENEPLHTTPITLTSDADTWVEVEITFEYSSTTMINGLVWQDTSGKEQSTFFIDDIEFIPNEIIPAPPVEISTAFSESFDGEPDQPEAWNPKNWDVTVHSRDRETWFELETMQADHGANCDAPPTTHTISAYKDAVFQCKNHMMTAINAEGYGVIYLTPDHMVDFSEEEAVISFDLSTARKSERDWVDIWITPYDDNLQLPLTDWLPDLNGEPREAIHISLDYSENSRFVGEVIHDFEAEALPSTDEGWLGYQYILEPSQKKRETFELRISNKSIKFGLPEHDFWWIDTELADLGWEEGVVQFGHHSYSPTKCNGCEANTWHWDNVKIEPAVEFTMISADTRYVDEETEADIHFDEPAPDDAHLRFAGIGNDLEISLDDGETWIEAELQAQEKQADEKFRSYWTPIPAGTTDIQIRGKSWWGAGWHVRDISIWSPNLID